MRIDETDLEVKAGDKVPEASGGRGGSSLLAHSEQANVSPTYADPNAGGRARLVDRIKSWSTLGDGKAREAECAI